MVFSRRYSSTSHSYRHLSRVVLHFLGSLVQSYGLLIVLQGDLHLRQLTESVHVVWVHLQDKVAPPLPFLAVGELRREGEGGGEERERERARSYMRILKHLARNIIGRCGSLIYSCIYMYIFS